MATEQLDQKPAYHTVAEVRLGPEGTCASVGLKATGLDVCLPDGQILHYDLEGRLTRVATPNVQWRRGLSHRIVRLRKRSRADGGGLAAEVLDLDAADEVVERARQPVREVHDTLCRGQYSLRRNDANRADAVTALGHVVSRAAEFDARAARHDLDRFRSLYIDVPILPPDQYGSFVLLATDGCVYNQCNFCGFYRGVEHRRRSPGQFQEHLQEAVAYHGGGLASRRSIFLGQANALVGPRHWREEILQTINSHFVFPPADSASILRSWWQGSNERFEDISAFLDVFTGARIDAEEFDAMRRLHLRRLYLGVETGDQDLLSWLNKPATPHDVLTTVESGKKGGLQVGVILLIGAGGERFFHSHIHQTVRLLNAMRLERGDYIYFSPLVEMPDTEYSRQALADHIEPLSPARMAEQATQIRAGLTFGSRRERPYIANYDVSHFVY